MSLNIIQTPNRLTPSNTEHVYNLDSGLSSQSQFKYVIKVYVNPYHWTDTNNVVVATTLKARPNKEGGLIID